MSFDLAGNLESGPLQKDDKCRVAFRPKLSNRFFMRKLFCGSLYLYFRSFIRAKTMHTDGPNEH